MGSKLRDLLTNAVALDIETAPMPGYPQEYALQPWRVNEGKARIDCISVARHTGEAKLYTSDWGACLKELSGQYVVTWNGLFDVSWLIAHGHWTAVKAIHWVDGMLLWKWLSNSQQAERIPKWSLGDGAKKFFEDEPWLEAFIAMKKDEQHAGENDAYWEQRAKLDAIVTAKICKVVVAQLDDKRLKSAMIEVAALPEIARSWLIGVNIDFDLLDSIRPAVVDEMRDIEFSLGVSNYVGVAAERVKLDTAFWTPSKILRSPKQLGTLLYGDWQLVAKNFSDKTGEASTDKAALTYLADDDDRALEILRWRELDTQLSKYIEAPKKARKYLGSDTMHPSPKLFSTYTGRMTYSSKTKKKYQTGVALHQWPRNKQLRALIKPPIGFKWVEFDASGQESRLMAELSGDPMMRSVFKQGQKFHAVTGARLAGLSYEDFMVALDANNDAVAGDQGFYKQGKFTGLSCNYRIGVKKLRVQARVQYSMAVDFHTALGWQEAFYGLYPSIKDYWKSAIAKGKAMGYAETLGGRRFQLEHWHGDDRWSTESSAINHPIQGSGADMKELAMQELAKHYPELIFFFDLHDGIHMLAAQDYPNEKLLEARDMLDNMDYEAAWGYKPDVPLTWDVQVGARWSELEEL